MYMDEDLDDKDVVIGEDEIDEGDEESLLSHGFHEEGGAEPETDF